MGYTRFWKGNLLIGILFSLMLLFSAIAHGEAGAGGGGGGGGGGNCTIPTDGMIITENTTFCLGTYDLPNGIEIGADDIVLDCDSALLNGEASGNGILLDNVKNAIIKNCNINNYTYGFNLNFSNQNVLINNTAAFSNRSGYYLYSSNKNQLIDNQAQYIGDEQTPWDNGFWLILSTNNLLKNNYAKNSTGDGFRLHTASDYNILIYNKAVNNSIAGFYSYNTSQNNLSNNNATFNGFGFEIHNSSNFTLKYNDVQHNSGYGFWIGYGGNHTMNYNIIYDNGMNSGIDLTYYGSTILNAEYNYWGSTNITKIQNRINDYSDELSRGIVDFCPYLDAPWPDGKDVNCDIDITPPSITILTPANEAFISGNSVWFNLTTDEAANCTYNLRLCIAGLSCEQSIQMDMGITGATSHSQLVTDDMYQYPGYNVLTATCKDSFLNSNTRSVTFYTDTTPPLINITTPVNDSFVANSSVWFNLTTNENANCTYWTSAAVSGDGWGAGGASIEFNMSNTGGKFHSQLVENITEMGPNGYNQLHAKCADAVLNSNNASVTFHVDTTPPSITILTPANNSNITTSKFWLNLTTDESSWCGYLYETCMFNFKGENVTDTLQEGETREYLLEGINYEILPIFTSSTNVIFQVGSELSASLAENDTYKFSDGTSITLIDVLYQDYAGGVHSATFLFNTTGRDEYCTTEYGVYMDYNWSTFHKKLVVPVLKEDATINDTYYRLNITCKDKADNSNSTSIRFYADYQPPMIQSLKITSLWNTDAVISWKSSEKGYSIFEYGLNTSYGLSSPVIITYPEQEYPWQLVNPAGLTPGTKYYYKITVYDPFGNKNTTEGSFTTLLLDNMFMDYIANQTVILQGNATNTTLEVITKSNVSDVGVIIFVTKDAPTPKSLNVGSLKYLQIEATPELLDALSSVLIKLHYSETELAAQNISESTLAIYWYNTSLQDWVKLDTSLGWVFGAGVNTADNYVWANVSHFSYYAAGGLIPDGYACTSGNQCVSGYCGNVCYTPSSEVSPSSSSRSSRGGGGGGGAPLVLVTAPAPVTAAETPKAGENATEEAPKTEASTASENPAANKTGMAGITGGAVAVGGYKKPALLAVSLVSILLAIVLVAVLIRKKAKSGRL
ncbi:MAG: right-handed parallel beta-helix repeat-containing protein [Candidatus Woesearchaeota archaeon]